MRKQENYVKKSQLPKDIILAKDQTTLTYGDLKKSIQDSSAETITLGIGTSSGFDSCMWLYRAVVVNNQLYLLTQSHISSSALQRNATILNLKIVAMQHMLYEPKAQDLIALDLPLETPVWIGVKKNFSWKGEMMLFAVETMGPQTFVTLDGRTEKEDEDYEVYHEAGTLSVWGEQLVKTPVKQKDQNA